VPALSPVKKESVGLGPNTGTFYEKMGLSREKPDEWEP
jgi:hypothetical protein